MSGYIASIYISVIKDILLQIRERGWTGETLVEELDLESIRTYGLLKRAGICHVNELVSQKDEDVYKIRILKRRLGVKALADIQRALKRRSLEFINYSLACEDSKNIVSENNQI